MSYYGIIWNHVCETFENHKALKNFKKPWFIFLKMRGKKATTTKTDWVLFQTKLICAFTDTHSTVNVYNN